MEAVAVTTDRISSNNHLPSFTAIIEWENAKLSELGRARDMLTSFGAQIAELGPELEEPPEIIILYDPEAIDPALISGLAGEGFRRVEGLSVRLVAAPNGSYYMQKNRGAREACRDLVLFLDSDVVPEQGWLRSLLTPLTDPQIQVVCGNTYIEPDIVYSRAFALFWFFPLRSEEEGLSPAPYFFANNVVFRRDLFNAYGFPDLPLVRGHCSNLARSLRKDGHTIYIQRSARVSHPPPNGLSHFLKRALCEGHDRALRAQGVGGERGRAFPLGAAARWNRSVMHALRQVRRQGPRIGLSPTGAVASVLLAAAYYTVCFAGEAVTTVAPRFVPKHFAV